LLPTLNATQRYLRSKRKGWPLELTDGVPSPKSIVWRDDGGDENDEGGGGGGDEMIEVEVEEEIEVEEEVEVAVSNEKKGKGEKGPPLQYVQYTVAVHNGSRVTTCAASVVLHGLVGVTEPLPLRGTNDPPPPPPHTHHDDHHRDYHHCHRDCPSLII
jgi:hypothetical protein